MIKRFAMNHIEVTVVLSAALKVLIFVLWSMGK